MRKNILITGASAGLGAEMARQFVARGRNVALCARRTKLLVDLRDELKLGTPGATVAIRTLDVDDHDEVFTTFRAFEEELGGLDRVIVNAGRGGSHPVGTGRFAANRQSANTNFISALAQCEAALELFRARNHGHLVIISSVAAFRGLRHHGATYSAAKAALSTLADGLYSEFRATPITVTTLHPGSIHTELTASLRRKPFIVDTTTGVAAMIRAMEREPRTATVPSWPWRPIGFIRRHAPLWIATRMV